MNTRIGRIRIGLLFACAGILGMLIPLRVSAQLAAGITAQQLWVDPASGQVFIRPGRNRVPLKVQGSNTTELERQIDQKVEAKMQAAEQELKASNAQLEAGNAELKQQVAQMQPAWKAFVGNFGSKIKIGTLLYGDYALYTHTGYGPQFLTQINPPGPENNTYNSFDITRTYLNFLFFPTDDWTVRITPNLYKTIGSANKKNGTNSAIGSSLDGNLGFRVKYAYLRYNSPFKWWKPAKEGTITIGSEPNPLIDWEEQMFGYRFVALVPWNYLSLSSSQVGVSIQGPLKFGELQYLDYDFGVFNNASFHANENTNTKEVMARLSAYPFGAKWRFDGLGVTGFINYGYGNVTPDIAQVPTALKGPDSAIMRVAALVHYSTEQMNIAFEYDRGKNAFSTGNLFSASGPPQAFGLAGPPQFTAFSTMAAGILNNGKSTQQGYNFFGHYHIPNTPFTLFGLYQWFLPNAKVAKDPLDFQRYVIGVGYQYNEFLRFALDSQNLTYYHDQFTFPVGAVANAVPRDTHAIFLNVEFNY